VYRKDPCPVTRYGYFLSSEEYDPAELVRQAFFEFFADQVLPRARES
jgi:hypothetical protein